MHDWWGVIPQKWNNNDKDESKWFSCLWSLLRKCAMEKISCRANKDKKVELHFLSLSSMFSNDSTLFLGESSCNIPQRIVHGVPILSFVKLSWF